MILNESNKNYWSLMMLNQYLAWVWNNWICLLCLLEQWQPQIFQKHWKYTETLAKCDLQAAVFTKVFKSYVYSSNYSLTEKLQKYLIHHVFLNKLSIKTILSHGLKNCIQFHSFIKNKIWIPFSVLSYSNF